MIHRNRRGDRRDRDIPNLEIKGESSQNSNRGWNRKRRLTHSYTELCAPTALRRERLLSRYGFVCSCPRCLDGLRGCFGGGLSGKIGCSKIRFWAGQTLEGSLSSVSMPIFATKYSFKKHFSSSTRFTHLRTAPNSKYSPKIVKLFRSFVRISAKNHHFFCNFQRMLIRF